jgi:hypothetical protein
MKQLLRTLTHSVGLLFFVLAGFNLNAQLKDYVLFGKTGVQIGTSTNILSGKVGSNTLVTTTGTSSFAGDIISRGKVVLANSNTVNGTIYAANATNPPAAGIVLQAGSNALLKALYGNGDIAVAGGAVGGPVFTTTGYTGPTPTITPVRNNPVFPPAPTLPIFYNLPTVSNNTNIKNSGKIDPGSYNSLALTGGKTDTFSRPGVYIFNFIKNSGNTNNLVFNFNNSATGNFKFYVIGDVDLYKVNISFINLPIPNATVSDVAARIYMQVGGTGTSSSTGTDAWFLANGASGNNQSAWYGTVWAPNGNVDVGSGSSPSKIVGALWSGKQVIVQSGVNVTFAPFIDCSPSANAGSDKNIDCDHPTTILNGSSTSGTAQFSWSKVGDTIPGNTSTSSIQVSKAGTYVLTVSSLDCVSPATDTVVVTSTRCVLPYYPPPLVGKVTSKIGAELTSLKENFGNVLDDGKTLFIIVGNKVLIDVIVMQGNRAQVKSMLLSTTYGMTDTVPNGESQLIITGLFPIANLGMFDQAPMVSLINFVRPSFPPVTSSGLIQTQGDRAINTDLARNGFNVAGNGIKIGVLSDSYNTLNRASDDMNNKDLPGPGDTTNSTPVSVLQDYPYGTRSDEGRAMLQIVHDIAPKAKLAFRTGFITPNDMAVGIRQLADSNCNVIVDDVTFVTEPFFRPGVIANAIRDVSARGVHYVTAAGNFGVKSYGAVFNPSTATLPTGIFGRAHNFGGGDIYQVDSVKGTPTEPGIYTIVLQWQEDFYSLGGNSGTSSDMDAFVIDNLGNIIGFNRVSTGGDAVEMLTLVVTQNTTIRIMVVNASLTTSPRFKYVVFRGDLKITNHQLDASTIVGQGNAPEAITVGAALYSNTPAYGVSNVTKASFSSVGGTIYNNAASPKPDIVGPNGVNTSINFGSLDLEGDGTPNFFGTSAAAPHVAGAVALMLEARRKFYNQTLTPPQVKQLIASSALDMDVTGFDYNTGNGFLRVDSAIRTMANPTPHIDSILLSNTNVPIGSQPMTITVYGSYLTSTTEILLNNDTLTSVVVNSHQITAQLPTFSGQQYIYAYNDPKSLLGNDGGLSNAYSITGIIKKNVTITANSQTKRYGERNPTLTGTILINNQPTTLTLQDLGLTGLTYTTLANSMSEVGQYFIHPSKTFDSTGASAPYLAFYNYTFVDGTLTVQKMPLTITPLDKTVTYGNTLGVIDYNYQFTNTNIDNASAYLDSIKKYHKAYTPDNALAVINGFISPLANGTTLSTADITGLNTLVSFQALKNSRRFQVVNNELVPVGTDFSSFNAYYLVDIAAQSIYNYKINPSSSPFISALNGYTGKALFSETSLANGTGQAILNGQLVQLVNGSLTNTVNGLMGAMAPIVNGQLVQLVNGQLVQLVNGQLVPLVNTQLVQLVNGQLVQLVNGEFVSIANGQLVQLVNGQLVQLVNGQLAQLVNGQLVQLVNGQLVQLVNGQLAQLVNGQLVPLVNGQLVQLVNGQLVQLVNGQLVPLVNGQLAQLVNSGQTQMVNGQLVQLVNGQLVQLVNSTSIGGTNNKSAVIVDETDASNQNGWLGAMFGINMITGLDIGTQKLIPGVFINKNFDVTYGLGTITIQPNPCLLTHSPLQNFSSTPKPDIAASMWLNVEVKVSGQLTTAGDYLTFTGGTISFNNVASTPSVNNLSVPAGKIIADANTTTPNTRFDTVNKVWITKVPVGFSSTSDIFITGAIINSSSGFVKKNGANSVLKGIFYSNRNYSDQWSFALAGYRPQFIYKTIADSGMVASMNGTYRAGTPIPIINNLVGGGSSGGGNNYSGSSSSNENFSSCSGSNNITQNVVNRDLNTSIQAETARKPLLTVYPNPAFDHVQLFLVPQSNGLVRIGILNENGKLVQQLSLGSVEANKSITKTINLARLGSGVYFIKYQNGQEMIMKKIVVMR